MGAGNIKKLLAVPHLLGFGAEMQAKELPYRWNDELRRRCCE